ncbi:MAG: hypothetical protein WA055_05785 [Candidatus Moraniibacteriota bacterium]
MDNQELDEKNLEEDSSMQSKVKEWLEDNMRIIVSILIVILIAGGIYSYSNRTESPEVDEPTIALNEENSSTIKEEQANDTSMIGEKETSSVATSQETESSLIETAIKGDSQTKLARRALADFLEKNPDSALTAEHKIYIEDYLRKNSGHRGKVSVGTSIEFSKDLIKDAISKSKNLNENQLKNLHKYAVRVPSLS